MQPALKYLGYEILKANFNRIARNKTETINVDINTNILFPSETDINTFDVFLDLKLAADNDFVFNIEAIGSFEIHGENITEHIRESFFNINAPSIVYPYLRAFVASFTALAGEEVINLPAINFIKLYEDKKNKQV
jgi:preprotein translocase subunit SecB